MKNLYKKIGATALAGVLLLSGCSSKSRSEEAPQPDISTPRPTAPYEQVTNIISHFARQGSQLYLYIPANMKITRPEEYLTTTEERYFITGTSDPNEPLYINDKEITNRGEKGTFGLFAELELAENFFTVRQGNFEQEIIINREEPGDGTPEAINFIPQDSMYPRYQGGTRVGKSLRVSCTAPSGALVLATLGDETITLEQSGETKRGLPATFTGSLPITGDFPADETTKIGPIDYTLKMGTTTERYQSSGEVYAAGEETNISFAVEDYVGFVYPDPADPSVFTEIVKQGATDYLMSQSNQYFELYSGGFIPTSSVRIVEGKDSVHNRISHIDANAKSGGEIYEFTGTGLSMYDVRILEDRLEFEVFNASIEDIPLPPPPSGSIFSQGEIAQLDRSVLITFPFAKKDMFWGYNVRFDGDHMLLEVQHRPILSGSPLLPLEGITVAIDPGHGGEDRGAPGPANDTGAMESDINLAHAFVLQNELLRLGADVILTRDTDAYYSLDERLEMHERTQADFFISLHHNSVPETVNGNEIFGTEAYYYTNVSAPVAESVMNHLADTTGRKLRGVNHSYYRVTMLPYSPSLLIELSFMCNPQEYEASVMLETMEKNAQGIAQGLVSALQ